MGPLLLGDSRHNRGAIARNRQLLDGFFLLRGDQDKLARIRSSEEFERLTVRGQLIIENLGIVGAALGGRLMSQLSIFGEQVEELT
jgi:hypothetical protein